LQIIKCPQSKGGGGVIQAGFAGDDDDHRMGAGFPEPFEQFDTVHVRQKDVQKHHIKGSCGKQLNGFLGSSSDPHPVSVLFENTRQQVLDALFIVYDQNTLFHSISSEPPKAPAPVPSV
jgi:hypothetical protein